MYHVNFKLFVLCYFYVAHTFRIHYILYIHFIISIIELTFKIIKYRLFLSLHWEFNCNRNTMQNPRVARYKRRMIMRNKAKRRRICDIRSSTIQIRSCNSIEPTNSTAQSVTECESSYRTSNEDIPSIFATKFTTKFIEF